MRNKSFDPEQFVILSCNPARSFVGNVVKMINEYHIKEGQKPIKFGNLFTDVFPGGEPCINVLESVREKHVHVFQCFRQINELPYLCQDFMEFLVVLDAIKRADAEKISVYLPYMPFQRQEKKISGREPITARLAFDLIEKACGANYKKLVTMVMHSPAGAGFSDRPVDILQSWPLFGSYVINILKLKPSEIVIVAPDAGAAKNARSFSEHLSCHFALIEKKRIKDKVVVYYLIGEEHVVDKTAIIFDDMIATAGTLIECDKLLLRKGAKKVFAFGTHGLFNPNKEEIPAELRCWEAGLKVVTTDTIPEKFKNYYESCKEWLNDVISASHFFADALYCNETGESLSETMKQYEYKFKNPSFLDKLIITKNKQIVSV